MATFGVKELNEEEIERWMIVKFGLESLTPLSK